ncbi:hypothetical protein DDT52_03760 [Brenneria roseae subsp. roseae]|uniref:MmyB family transcriptional regulator n=1 Tax=Brenneria roseae TaxID=1509241 RepID=UPI000D60B177|nr:hypothetical protein [Brenneria roseae]PWC22374.1 hypothetical protein DDT52_03760 [Brenneria roseae subsp. roseae]
MFQYGKRSITQHVFQPWEQQAPLILASFKRDFARAPAAHDIRDLVKDLEKVSPDFKTDWRQPDVHGSCSGIRDLVIDDVGAISFEHATLTIDEDRHLRLVLIFTSGTSDGEAIGNFQGEELYHSSLSEQEFRTLLNNNDFDVIKRVKKDPECGGRTVWLAGPAK